jgi:hypothetical protein
VHTIHCHFCGGVVPARAKIEYRPPRSSAQVALSHMGTCTCTPPIVYEDSPLDAPPADDERVEPVEPVERVERPKRVERREPDAPPRRQDPSDPWKGAA